MSLGVGTTHCRISRNLFELTGTGAYLGVSGDDNEIDHNTFQNKTTEGQMITIQGPGGSGMAQRTWIHHNYFLNFSATGLNNCSSIQIGLSGRSMSAANSLVEYNLFSHTRGENENICNKSGANTYRYNTIRDNCSELSLRHGNGCRVYGNYFYGSDGLRFFGDDHRIFSNYFEGNPRAINIGNGDAVVPPGALTSHDRPDRVWVMFNTLVNNTENVIMSGRTNGLGATDLVFANNIIQGGGAALSLGGPVTNPRWEGNIIWNTSGAGSLPASGYRSVNPLLAPDAKGISHLQSGSPAIDVSAGSYPDVTVDMDGQPRNGSKDTGADEYSAAPAVARPLTTADVGPSAP
jgi:poly(beta-D-mannuronate) lyase